MQNLFAISFILVIIHTFHERMDLLTQQVLEHVRFQLEIHMIPGNNNYTQQIGETARINNKRFEREKNAATT